MSKAPKRTKTTKSRQPPSHSRRKSTAAIERSSSAIKTRTGLDQSLKTLEDADLLRRIDTPEFEFLFKHVLVQESAYSTLLIKARHQIHRAVAESIEFVFPSKLDEYAVRLAQHYAEAGDNGKTLEYLIRSGNAAAKVYANDEAIEQYSQALIITTRDPSLLDTTRDLFVKRGRVFELSGRQELALQNYSELEQLARERQDSVSELEALIRRATIHSAPTAKFDPVKAQSLSDTALTLARAISDRAAESKILWNLMLLNFFIGEATRAIEYGEASLKIARETNLPEQIAYTLNDLSNPYLSLGRYESSEKCLFEARVIWKALDNKPMLSDNLITHSTVLWCTGKFDESIAEAEEGYRLSRTIGNLWGQSYSRMNTSFPLFELGRWDECIASLEEAIETGKRAGFLVGELAGRALLGVLHAILGDFEKAIDLATQALAARGPFAGWGSTADGALALIYAFKGDSSRAEEHIRKGYVDFRFAQTDPFLAAYSWMAESEIALISGDASRARAAAEKLRALLEPMRTPLFYYDTFLEIGRAAVIEGRYDEAYSEMDRALTLAEKVNSRRALLEIYPALGKIEKMRGHPQTSSEYFMQGREVLDFLVGHTPEQFRTSFLNSRRVKSLWNEE